MSPRTIVRNSGRVLNFVLTALALFCAIYFGCAFVDTLITFVWSSVHIPIAAVVGAALALFVVAMVQTYRNYPAPHMIPDATVEIRSWVGYALVIDLILGLVNYCPGILPGTN